MFLKCICAVWVALLYTPKAWKLTRIVFIPKDERTSCAGDFRLIYLTSFLLKMLEKLVDMYVREMRHLLHPNQYGYHIGYSTALHSVTIVEKQLKK